jgi:hypothetical protein
VAFHIFEHFNMISIMERLLVGRFSGSKGKLHEAIYLARCEAFLWQKAIATSA